jgi:hypothetical protein
VPHPQFRGSVVVALKDVMTDVRKSHILLPAGWVLGQRTLTTQHLSDDTIMSCFDQMHPAWGT